MYDAVIFDMDGLLIDTESVALAAGVEACAALGYDVSLDFMHTLIGVDDKTGWARLTAHVGEALDIQQLNREWNRACDKRFADGIPQRPNVLQVLDHIDARALPKAIATSSRRARAIEKLAMAGLAGRFETLVGVDCVENPKPAPDPYLRAAALLGIAPDRCVAFEDSDTGVRAALAAGMTVVQVPDVVRSAENRAHHTADTLLEGAKACGLI
ncbi:HAD family hydrolase [Actibacterium lipolyticum]|uniref:Phosphorylated carbohydrates phosphatase n=1 Tax=Actibacterium lipolyticum TaxID=1524263 RepID=A0A238KQP7_9RHOB|nr:HAD family phosphatase [Actibacterium lipolyticum]SMX45133.1 Phosphorylated carbohydrates phosphatase [Actibacterium lipolyticum]